MSVCSRSIYLSLNERCFFSSASAVLKRDFQDVHPKNLLALRYQFVYNSLNTC